MASAAITPSDPSSTAGALFSSLKARHSTLGDAIHDALKSVQWNVKLEALGRNETDGGAWMKMPDWFATVGRPPAGAT